MAPPHRLQTSSSEGSILLAISALKSNRFKSVKAAAKAYNVLRSTLFRRVYSSTSRDNYRPKNTRLTNLEEGILI